MLAKGFEKAYSQYERLHEFEQRMHQDWKKKSQKNLNQKIEYKLLKRLNEEKKNERECFDWEMNLIFQEQKRKSELNDFKALVDIDECEEKNIKDKMESRERVNG